MGVGQNNIVDSSFFLVLSHLVPFMEVSIRNIILARKIVQLGPSFRSKVWTKAEL